MIENTKKIFNYDNISESKNISINDRKNEYKNSISAAGCLFYKIVKHKIYLLLISYADPKWPKLDDFGGKVDITDETILDTIKREVQEETNKVILLDIKNLKYELFYNKHAKYYSILTRVDDTFNKDTSVFGKIENTDQIYRKIKWYEYSKVKKQLAYRLLNNLELISYLDMINHVENYIL